MTAGAARRGLARYQRRFAYWTLSPLVVYTAVFSVAPILWAFGLAFFDYSARRRGAGVLGLGGDNPFVGLEHFRRMLDFSDAAPLEVRLFHTSLRNTLLFAVLVLPLNFLITLPLASLIESAHRRLRPLVRTLFFLPVVTSAVGVAIMWGFIYHPQRGLLNTLISQVAGRLVAIGWTTDPSLEVAGVPVVLLAAIVAYVWQDFGYNLVIFIAAIQAIPESLREAARIDGAGSFKVFTSVTLPLLRPTIMLAAVLTTISSFQVFDIIQVMTQSGPARDQARVMTIDIFDNAFRFQRMGWAAAVSLVLFVIVLLASLAQSRLLRTQWEYA